MSLLLDYTISSRKDRVEYIRNLLTTYTPTQTELNTIADYILWAQKDKHEGINLKAKHSTWDGPTVESLDELAESPTFNEAAIKLNALIPPKAKREVFSRTKARKNAPPYIREIYEELWHRIDSLEALVAMEALASGRRKKPLRDSLVSSLGANERKNLEAKAKTLKGKQLSDIKHELVELRRQQYTLRDSYSPVKLNGLDPQIEFEGDAQLGSDIKVKPINVPPPIKLKDKVWKVKGKDKDKLVNNKSDAATPPSADQINYLSSFTLPARPLNLWPSPADFSEDELKIIGKWLWGKDNRATGTQSTIDISDPAQLKSILGNYYLLKSAADNASEVESGLPTFVQMIDWAIAAARLSEAQRIVLEGKLRHKGNKYIQDRLKDELGLHYGENYISTIYCKKCIPLIAAASKELREVMENLAFPENFKTCRDCGAALLMNNDNFTHCARSSDGFASRCKICEKLKRKGGR